MAPTKQTVKPAKSRQWLAGLSTPGTISGILQGYKDIRDIARIIGVDELEEHHKLALRLAPRILREATAFCGLSRAQIGELSPEEIEERLLKALASVSSKETTNPVPTLQDILASESVPSHTPLPQPEYRLSRKMIEDEYASKLGRILAQRTIIKGGTRYFPLSFAAPLAQAPETTLRDWIKKKTKFGGRAIQTHTSPASGIYISEASVSTIANRFLKWPSREPAGTVTIGQTDDQTGYIGLTDAAQTLRIERHTLWRWATKGTTPTEKPLDIIKCPASEQFYISEKDVARLAHIVPRSGLPRGPRPQLVLHT